MKTRLSVYFVLAGILSFLLSACGGGGGGTAFLPVNSVSMTADKTKALASGTEDVTMTATVRDYLGNPLGGTAISFVISAGSGSLHSADVVTSASGTAAVKVSRGPVSPPATNEIVTVTASSASASGSASVKFINLPSSATVEVGFNKVVTNMATFTFDVVSTPTQSPIAIVEPINQAATGNFIPNVNTFASLLYFPDTYTLLTTVNPAITTVPNSAIVRLTYLIDPLITSLPTYELGTNAAHVTASGPLPAASAIPVVPADLFMTLKFDTE